MNLQQLEYIVAIDRHRHFAKAAEACFVTQATLSMMVKKLESELDVVLFDRTKQPVTPTEQGKEIITQAATVLREAALIKQLAADTSEQLSGEIRLAIIPTLAPYLLPLFLPEFLKTYPLVKLSVHEYTTEMIVEGLANDEIDFGIVATPLQYTGIKEDVLFYEPLKVFVSEHEKLLPKKYLAPEQLDVNRLWLLEEGHCLRSQMLNLCQLQKAGGVATNLRYEAGSIESLLRIVEVNNGITIVPELATLTFDAERKKRLRLFKEPTPVREISLVTYRHFAKRKLHEALRKTIVEQVKPIIKKLATKDIVEIDL